MSRELLSDKVTEIATHLREQADTPASANDVATLVSALSAVIDAHFKHVDIALHSECRAVAADLAEVAAALVETTPHLHESIRRILVAAEEIAATLSRGPQVDAGVLRGPLVAIADACTAHESAARALNGMEDILGGLKSRIERLIGTLQVPDGQQEDTKFAVEEGLDLADSGEDPEDSTQTKPILKPVGGRSGARGPDMQTGRETTRDEIDALFS